MQQTRGSKGHRTTAESVRARRETGSTTSLVLLIAMAICLMALTACTAIRPRDDQRVALAGEAADLAGELRDPAKDPFTAMTANAMAVETAWQTVSALQEMDRQDTFYADLNELTRPQILDELKFAITTHLESVRASRRQVAIAAAEVKTALERRREIQGVMAMPKGTRLEDVITSVADGIRQLETLQVHLSQALDAIESRDSKASERQPTESTRSRSSAFESRLAAANDVLSQIPDDPELQAATQSLLRSGTEIASAERRRLEEMRSHLQTVRRLREALEDRNTLYFDKLVFRILPMVSIGKDDLDGHLDEIRKLLGPEDSTISARIDALKADPEIGQIIEERAPFWCDGCGLTEFVAACIKAQSETSESRLGTIAMKNLVASLGILLFAEVPQDRASTLALARQNHLHSIRLSQISSQQRLDLARQVAEGLAIYYQGGISPAELAQAILLSSQTLATGVLSARI